MRNIHPCVKQGPPSAPSEFWSEWVRALPLGIADDGTGYPLSFFLVTAQPQPHTHTNWVGSDKIIGWTTHPTNPSQTFRALSNERRPQFWSRKHRKLIFRMQHYFEIDEIWKTTSIFWKTTSFISNGRQSQLCSMQPRVLIFVGDIFSIQLNKIWRRTSIFENGRQPQFLKPLSHFLSPMIGWRSSWRLYCVALIGQKKRTLISTPGLSRVNHLQVYLCTSVQRLE